MNTVQENVNGQETDRENHDVHSNQNELGFGNQVSDSEEEKDYTWMYDSESENESMNGSDDENDDGMEGISAQRYPSVVSQSVKGTNNDGSKIGNKKENGQ